MSRLNVSNLFNENEDGAPVVSGISTFSSPHYFVPPSGSTAQRPQNPGEGMIRFNTDSGHLEYYSGELWVDVIVNNNEVGVSTFANTISARGTGTRGLTGGGYTTSKQNLIDYLTIQTLGNSHEFGELTERRYWIASLASSTRGVWGGGGVSPTSPNKTDRIDYVTIASTGDAIDFGDLVEARYGMGGCSNSTRGLFCGGYRHLPHQDVVNFIDYITIASSGVDAQDFGNLTVSRQYMAATASSVRGVFLSGRTGTGPFTYHNTIDYATISTKGNAQNFGDLATTAASGMAAANSTRALYAGNESNTSDNSITFITIATTGDAQDFGDLPYKVNMGSAVASSTRVVTCGGYLVPNNSVSDIMQHVTIATTGNALDFGDLSLARYSTGSCSNGHGGL